MALFSTVSGSLELVALVGDPAPGIGLGVYIVSFSRFSLGENGHIAFTSQLACAGIGATIVRAVFTTNEKFN